MSAPHQRLPKATETNFPSKKPFTPSSKRSDGDSIAPQLYHLVDIAFDESELRPKPKISLVNHEVLRFCNDLCRNNNNNSSEGNPGRIIDFAQLSSVRIFTLGLCGNHRQILSFLNTHAQLPASTAQALHTNPKLLKQGIHAYIHDLETVYLVLWYHRSQFDDDDDDYDDNNKYNSNSNSNSNNNNNNLHHRFFNVRSWEDAQAQQSGVHDNADKSALINAVRYLFESCQHIITLMDKEETRLLDSLSAEPQQQAPQIPQMPQQVDLLPPTSSSSSNFDNHLLAELRLFPGLDPLAAPNVSKYQDPRIAKKSSKLHFVQGSSNSNTDEVVFWAVDESLATTRGGTTGEATQQRQYRKLSVSISNLKEFFLNNIMAKHQVNFDSLADDKFVYLLKEVDKEMHRVYKKKIAEIAESTNVSKGASVEEIERKHAARMAEPETTKQLIKNLKRRLAGKSMDQGPMMYIKSIFRYSHARQDFIDFNVEVDTVTSQLQPKFFRIQAKGSATVCLPEPDSISYRTSLVLLKVFFVGQNKLLLILRERDTTNNAMIVRLISRYAQQQQQQQVAEKELRLRFADFVSFDETTRQLAFYSRKRSKLSCYKFNNDFTKLSLQSKHDLSAFFDESCNITHMEIIYGTHKICLIDDTYTLAVFDLDGGANESDTLGKMSLDTLAVRPFHRAMVTPTGTSVLLFSSTDDPSLTANNNNNNRSSAATPQPLYVQCVDLKSLHLCVVNAHMSSYSSPVGGIGPSIGTSFFDEVSNPLLGQLPPQFTSLPSTLSSMHLAMIDSKLYLFACADEIVSIRLDIGNTANPPSSSSQLARATTTCKCVLSHYMLKVLQDVYQRFPLTSVLGARLQLKPINLIVLMDESQQFIEERLLTAKCVRLISKQVINLTDMLSRISKANPALQVKSNAVNGLVSLSVQSLHSFNNLEENLRWNQPWNLSNFIECLLCTVPLHVLSIVPPSENASSHLRLHLPHTSSATTISESFAGVHLGLYESLLNDLARRQLKVRVICSFGKRQSELVNVITGTLFDTRGSASSDGVWMSIRIDADVAYVVFNFEGLATLERQELLLMMCLNCALADVSFLHTDLQDAAVKHNTSVLFDAIQDAQHYAADNSILFNGLLMAIAKEHNNNEESQSKLRTYVNNKLTELDNNNSNSNHDNNDSVKMFNSSVANFYRANPAIADPSGCSGLDLSQIAECIINKQKHSFASIPEFMIHFKTILAKILLCDDKSVSSFCTELRIEILERNLQTAIGKGKEPSGELCNYFTGTPIPDVNLFEGVIFDAQIPAKKSEKMVEAFSTLQDSSLVLLDPNTPFSVLYNTLLSIFQARFPTPPDTQPLIVAEWKCMFKCFIESIIRRRESRVKEWFEANIAGFEQAYELIGFKQRMDNCFVDMKSMWTTDNPRMGGTGSSSPATRKRSTISAGVRPAMVDLDSIDELPPSPEPARESRPLPVIPGKYVLRAAKSALPPGMSYADPGSPSIRAAMPPIDFDKVSLPSPSIVVQPAPSPAPAPASITATTANKNITSPRKEVSPAPSPRSQLSSPRSIDLSPSESPAPSPRLPESTLLDKGPVSTIKKAYKHVRYPSVEKPCKHTCSMKNCTNQCARDDIEHLSSDDPDLKHHCGRVHTCPYTCDENYFPGFCAIETSVVKGKQVSKGVRHSCTRIILPFRFEHDGPHCHTLTDAPHYCGVPCPACGHPCTKPIRHAGRHDTVHGNMVHTEFVSDKHETIITLPSDQKKLRLIRGQTGAPITCKNYCQCLGRGHFHILPYPNPTPETIEDLKTKRGRRPQRRRYGPHEDLFKQEVTHDVYWSTINFEDPCRDEPKHQEFSSCPCYCTHESHGGRAESFCTLHNWHRTFDPSNKKVSYNDEFAVHAERFVSGHLSSFGHHFKCVHEYHSYLIIDASKEMLSEDAQPNKKIFQKYGFNNRLGCAFEFSLQYMQQRRNASLGRDHVTVLLFSSAGTSVLLDNEPITNYCSFLDKIANTKALHGSTQYSVGLEKAIHLLTAHRAQHPDRPQPCPLFILFTCGKAVTKKRRNNTKKKSTLRKDAVQKVEQLIQDQKKLSKDLIIHTICIGKSGDPTKLKKIADLGHGVFFDSLDKLIESFDHASEKLVCSNGGLMLLNNDYQKYQLTRRRTFQTMDNEREKSTMEILQTERAYVGSLEKIMELFYFPLSKNHALISEADFHLIFGGIENIYQLNRELLGMLEDRLGAAASETHDVSDVSDVFNKFAPHFKVYTVYTNKYDQAIRTLVRCKENNDFKQFLKIRKDLHDATDTNALSLADLLIMPIQRIPRYKLLLESVLANTTQEEHGVAYTNLKSAVESIKTIAAYINDQISERQKLHRMIAIEPRLRGVRDLIQPDRKLIKEGKLKVIPPKESTQHDVIVFLFNDIIIEAVEMQDKKVRRSKLDPANGNVTSPTSTSSSSSSSSSSSKTYTYYQVQHVFPMNGLIVNALDDEKSKENGLEKSFQIGTSMLSEWNDMRIYTTNTVDEKNSWVATLYKQIEEFSSRRRNNLGRNHKSPQRVEGFLSD